MADLTLTALDGAQVVASGSEVPPTRAGCTSLAVLNLGGHYQEFTAGDADFARAQAASMSVREEATYRLRQGRIRISVGRTVWPDDGMVTDFKHVAWEGSDHSLGTVVYHADTQAVLALLDAVEIEEDVFGTVLSPRDTRASLVESGQHAPAVLVPIPGQGLLQAFKLTGYWRSLRPRWSGARVRAGELYAERTDAASPTALLYGSSAVARIYLNDKANRLSTKASDLAFTWSTR